MSLNYNGTEITNVKFNGTQLDKVIYNGTTVWENLEAGYSSANTYKNTGSGTTAGNTYSWTRDIGVEVKPTSVSFSSTNNRGTTCYWTFYGSTDNSTWVQLATASNSGGTSTVSISTSNFYRYYKVSQRNANWRRDDGNYVFSIEPWRIDYLKRKN